MENQGFSQRARARLSVSPCTKIIKLLFSYLLSKQHTWVPTSTDVIGKPVQGYKVSRPLILTVTHLFPLKHVLNDGAPYYPKNRRNTSLVSKNKWRSCIRGSLGFTSGCNLIFAGVSFRVRDGAPRVRSLRTTKKWWASIVNRLKGPSVYDVFYR